MSSINKAKSWKPGLIGVSGLGGSPACLNGVEGKDLISAGGGRGSCRDFLLTTTEYVVALTLGLFVGTSGSSEGETVVGRCEPVCVC